MNRIKMVCPYYKKCGSCNLLEHTYEEQINIKKDYLSKLLMPFCKLEKPGVIGMENPLCYRNKVHAVFTTDKKGNVISGIYEEGTHKVVSVEKCIIEDGRADAIIATIRRLIPSFKLKIYNEDKRTGLLRHVLIRTAHVTGQIMVILVMGSNIFPSKNNFVKALLKEHPEITTIVMNINDRKTSMILGDRSDVLYGKGYIEDELCGNTFRISPKSFYQVNSVQTEILYNKAMEYAGLTGKENVIDAYCGIGTIGITAAKHAGKVIGVELNPDAVRDAKNNSKRNNIQNITFYCDDAGKFMTKMAQEREHVDVVFMDPPRTGSDEAFLKCVAKLSPEKIVYISCGPETLVRDLISFKKKGYLVEKAVGVDLFPGTKHVETVVLLSKGVVDKDNFRKVKVDFSLEDMDLTELRGKATYAQVKEYILNEFGLKVSSLYIAQVKKKCGLEIGKNSYLPKSEDARQPQVTPEKEEAIMKAFRHFGVIEG